MTKSTKNTSQREWPTCSLQCAAQIRPVEVALYWLKLITDQLKVNFFGGISCGSPIEVCRLLIEKVRFPVFKRSATWKRTAVSFDLWWSCAWVFCSSRPYQWTVSIKGRTISLLIKEGCDWVICSRNFFSHPFMRKEFFSVRACACMTFFPPLCNSLLKKVEAKQFLSKRTFYNLYIDI